MMKFKTLKINNIKVYGIITVGLFLSSLGWTEFLIPSDIIGGGITGLAALIYFATGIPVGPLNLAVNAILILFSFKVLGHV